MRKVYIDLAHKPAVVYTYAARLFPLVGILLRMLITVAAVMGTFFIRIWLLAFRR